MRTILVLVRKDFLNFRRHKAALWLTFIIPFAMIGLFGYVFGIYGKDDGPGGVPVAVVNASTSPGAAKLLSALRAEKSLRVISEFTNPDKTRRPLTEADLRPLMQQAGADFRFALVLPADLVSETKFGLHLKVFSNPRNEIETQMVHGLIQKTIFSSVPELMGQSLQAQMKNAIGEERFDRFNDAIAHAITAAYGGDPAAVKRRIVAGDFFSPASAAKDAGGVPSPHTTGAPLEPAPAAQSPAADLVGRLIHIDSEQVVGANVKNRQATSLVGGWAIQFLLFALSASAASLFRERDAGIFQRLLAAPVTRAQILWSKFLYGVTLGLVQLVVLFVASSFLYGIEVLPHLPLLVLVCIFSAAACTSFGMLLAAISSSPEAASGLATFLIMLMSAIGGAWFPISFMPAFIQQFSKLTLVYWSIEGFSAVLWAGQGFLQILPILGILAAITALVMSLAVWRFNRSKVFG